ncbi:MAG: MoaD/ThiS family protein [Flavobacteriaceae bacterium]|jgi:molybdopterin converting factor small subunit
MEITVCYFGLLAETVQKEEEILVTHANTLGDLRKELLARYPPLKNSTFVMAQNNEIKSEGEALLQAEVALFPPFSGG